MSVPAQNNGGSARPVRGRPFERGRSPNPGGRARGLARTTRELFGDDGVAIVEFWLAIVEDESARTADRLEASRLLADRGWGRAAQFEPIPKADPLGVSGEQAERMAKALTDEEAEELHGLMDRLVERIGE